MLPPPPSSALPSASVQSELAGQAMASPGLVGPLHNFQVAAAVALTLVASWALPLLPVTTHSVVAGTHDTAFMLFPESIVCLSLGGTPTGINAVTLPDVSAVTQSDGEAHET